MANPYEPSVPGNAKKSGGGKTVMIVLIVIGVVVLLGVLACGGCIALAYFGSQKVLNDQMTTQLRANPAAQGALGEIQSVSINFTKTGQRPGNLVFDVSGSKGSGEAVARQNPANQQNPLELVELKMSTGEVVDLTGGAVAP